jgi:iron complex outermembrane receptor protein
MTSRYLPLLVGASLVAISAAFPSAAQTVPATPTAGGEETLGEIVVTARRRSENLQNVPGTINVVTAQDVQKFNIVTMVDTQKLVPGLSLSDGGGFAQTASMRGVSYNQIQAAPDTVAFYLNDVNMRAMQVFQAFYDIGQIETARGPQGTVRGKTAPSGTVTVTTKRPDLDRFGGYLQGTAASLDADNLQGAVSVPVVPGKLAMRFSALWDQNSENHVRSVFDPKDPKQSTEAMRLTTLFQPVDDFQAVLVYQHLRRKDRYYNGSYGPGADAVPGNPFAPAGFNGPPIGLHDLRSNAAGPVLNSTTGDTFSLQMDWNVLGQHLAYVGGYNSFKIFTNFCAQEPTTSPFPCFSQIANNSEKDWTQEIRLSSAQPLFGHLDYTLGYFYTNNAVPSVNALSATYLPGAFGSPLGPAMPGTPNSRYAVQGTLFTLPNVVRENAVYGSLTYHFDPRTELTAGLRWSKYFHSTDTTLTFPSTYTALALPASICGAVGGAFAATYANVCDFPVNVAPFHEVFADDPHPVIYNVELSHRFNDDLMVYAKTGSAFRAGNISLALAISTDNPALRQYLFPSDEKSKSYEVGAKMSFFQKRLQIDIDYYHQTFDGYFYQTLPTYYLKTSGPSTSVSTLSFTANAPAIVDGVELTASGAIAPGWTINGSLSYAYGRLDNAVIPCNSSQFNGVVDNIAPTVAQFQAAGVSVATCKSNASTSTDPRLTFNVESDYERPITDDLTGFVRGLLYFHGRNPNADPINVVPAYAVLDLYAGIRSASGNWEITAFVKNVAQNRTATLVGSDDTWPSGLSAFFGPGTGYFGVTRLPPRQYGITAHYNFGPG